MKLSLLMYLHVFAVLFFGLLLFFAPQTLAEHYEIEGFDEVGLYLARFIGYIYLAIGVMAWLMRNVGPSEARRAFLIGLVVFNFGISVCMAHAIIIGTNGSMGWMGVALGIFLGGACLHFLWKNPLPTAE